MLTAKTFQHCQTETNPPHMLLRHEHRYITVTETIEPIHLHKDTRISAVTNTGSSTQLPENSSSAVADILTNTPLLYQCSNLYWNQYTITQIRNSAVTDTQTNTPSHRD